MPTKKLSKKPTKKELETKRLQKLWRDTNYNKFMPFGNFRKLVGSVKSLPTISTRCRKKDI